MNTWLRNLIISFLGTIVVVLLVRFPGGFVSEELGIIIFFGYWITLNQWELIKNETKKNRKNKEKA